MSKYQVIARKFRPQVFRDVLGQEAIVTTLKNAIKYKRLAQAYLFCGSRGTGKTTLARVFAKALNCQMPNEDGEPCNQCSSCKEITGGNSLDVLEIDGASHRGIDDIRQINETVGYATSSGKYKIYIIDEVHMLTKEAFNALLKTLEEPPPKVIFLFATTEPHKVLPTILSRCQRFNLNRIPLEKIIDKLKHIAQKLGVNVDDEALHLLAERADGGLRDAESLFDQIIAFHDGSITVNTVADVLGVMPKDTFFSIDEAGKKGNLAMAFEVAHTLFSQGKDLIHFVEGLTEHFRMLILIKLSGLQAPFLAIPESDKLRYEASAKLYTNEQCLNLLDFLIESQQQIRFQPSSRIALEAILLRILRIHQRLPVEYLVRRLSELEQVVASSVSQTSPLPTTAQPTTTAQPSQEPSQKPSQELSPTLPLAPPKPTPPVAPPKSALPPAQSTSEDPTPTHADLGKMSVPKITSKAQEAPTASAIPKSSITPSAKSVESIAPPPSFSAAAPLSPIEMQKQSRYDTLFQFAAVELEGTIQKKLH